MKEYNDGTYGYGHFVERRRGAHWLYLGFGAPLRKGNSCMSSVEHRGYLLFVTSPPEAEG